jgi:hypothetical protein
LHEHFIHEFTHVLQAQQGQVNWIDGSILHTYGKLTGTDVYAYDKNDLGRPLWEFNMEQQAQIVAHYFTNRHHYIPPQFRPAALQTIQGFQTQRPREPLRGPFSIR